jgi:hypothetical protein
VCYQLLTLALISSLTLSLFMLVPIVLFGVYALASIQSHSFIQWCVSHLCTMALHSTVRTLRLLCSSIHFAPYSLSQPTSQRSRQPLRVARASVHLQLHGFAVLEVDEHCWTIACSSPTGTGIWTRNMGPFGTGSSASGAVESRKGVRAAVEIV